MTSEEQSEIIDSAQRAQRRSDCPYKAGTPEHTLWARTFAMNTKGAERAEVRSAQEARLVAQGRKTTSYLPRQEHDDPALAVLNIEDPEEAAEAELLEWHLASLDALFGASSLFFDVEPWVFDSDDEAIERARWKAMMFGHHYFSRPVKFTDIIIS